MNFRTFYIQSCGQPVNHVQTHASIFEAIKAWRDNCGSLLANSGGASFLDLITDKVEEDSNMPPQHRLIWRETAEESYPVGEGWFQAYIEAIAMDVEDSGKELTPDYIVDWINAEMNAINSMTKQTVNQFIEEEVVEYFGG